MFGNKSKLVYGGSFQLLQQADAFFAFIISYDQGVSGKSSMSEKKKTLSKH